MCHKGRLKKTGIIKRNKRSREKGVNPQGITELSQKEKCAAKALRCLRKHGFSPENTLRKEGV